MNKHKGSMAIRLDATRRIGSGHAMRCLSVANSIKEVGLNVIFLVSCDESADFLRKHAADVFVLPGDPLNLTSEDALSLVGYCTSKNIETVLIDTYGASDDFHNALNTQGKSLKIAFFEDMYSYDYGAYSQPRFFEYDMVINYAFNATHCGYERVYKPLKEKLSHIPKLLLGPSYAPIRSSFQVNKRSHLHPDVKKILITSGSTNPNHSLERMTRAALNVASGKQMEIGVVVGAHSSFALEVKEAESLQVKVLKNIADLSSQMFESDLVISSGGSTLYELACVGVPTIALPVVQNQLSNVKGFFDYGLGLASFNLDWECADLCDMLTLLVDDYALRRQYSDRMKLIVDGLGSGRIARYLLELSGKNNFGF